MRLGFVLAAAACALISPAAAHAGAVNVALSSGKLTLTGSSTSDIVTIDYQALDDPAGKPARFEIIAGTGTTLTGVTACTEVSNTNHECATNLVSSFEFNAAEGNDTLNLVDEDPSRGTDALTANLGAGEDRLDTSSPYLGRLTITTWSDPITGNGEDGNDYLEGSTGADTLNGGNGADTVNASTGADTISGGGDNDTLRGSSDNDTISGSSGDDNLFGDTGDDTLTPGSGTDTVDGGTGTDLASYADRVTISFLGITAASVDVSLDGVANDGAAREGDNVGPGVENLTGGAAGDVLTGDDGANVLLGGNGDDDLRGLGGADVLDGQSDSDSVRGGAGADDLRDSGAGGADTVDYSDAPAGVRADLVGGPAMGVEADPDTLAPAFENLTGGPGNDDLNGNAGDNRLVGGAGNDIVDGLAGNDSLDGGAGNDRLDAGDGADTALGDIGNDLIEGGAGADPRLDGGDGADVVFGGPGGPADADSLAGGQGRDAVSYEGRATGVSVTMDTLANDGGVGEKDNVASDFEGVFGGNGPDVLRLTAVVRLALVHVPVLRPVLRPATIRPRTAAAALREILPGRFAQGGRGNDTIIGSTGNDALSGGAGRDRVNGGAGNDAVHGGSGNDVVDGDADNDVVYGDAGDDFLTGDDGSDVVFGADEGGKDKAECGEDEDSYLKDGDDSVKKDSPCETTVGVDDYSEPNAAGNAQDGGGVAGLGGDGSHDGDGDGETGALDWPEDLTGSDYEDFGAEFTDEFFGFDEVGDLGDPNEIASAVIVVPTKQVRVKRDKFNVKLECPKQATRRCVGEITVTVQPKNGKEKELASELFRTNKGKKATLSFKFRAKLRKLIPKGKKGIKARVVIEARDSGDRLFGLDQVLTLRR